MNSVADNLIKIRKKNGLSQEEFADRVGVSRQTVSLWELDTVAPKASRIEEICRVFHISSNELFLNNEETFDDKDLVIDRDEIKRELEIASSKRKRAQMDTKNKFSKNTQLGNNKKSKAMPVVDNIKESKMLKRKVARFFLVVFIIYVLYCLYRFAVIFYVTKRVEKYKYLGNYFCTIRSYENSNSEITKIWYKDNKYKIAGTIQDGENSVSYIHWINLDTNERREWDSSTNKIETYKLSEENKQTVYENGKYMYEVFPDCINKKKINYFLFSVAINKFYFKIENNIFELYSDKNIIQFYKDSFLPISGSKIIKENKNIVGIRYYDIKLNETNDYDISINNYSS